MILDTELAEHRSSQGDVFSLLETERPRPPSSRNVAKHCFHGLGSCEIFAALPIAGNLSDDSDSRRSEPVRAVGNERTPVTVLGGTVRDSRIRCAAFHGRHTLASAQKGWEISANPPGDRGL